MKTKPNNYQKLIYSELQKINHKIDIVLMAKMKDQPEEKELSFQELLDSTQRIQYTNKEVVNSVNPCPIQVIELFKVGNSVSNDDLEKEYKNRGLVPAHPYALTLYSKNYKDIVDEKKYVGTHWKGEHGNWYYAAFRQWNDGERHVDVNRYDDDWDDARWWFAGVRK